MQRVFLIVAMGKLTGMHAEWLSLSDFGSNLSLHIKSNVEIFPLLLLIIFLHFYSTIDWLAFHHKFDSAFFFIIPNSQFSISKAWFTQKSNCCVVNIASWNSHRDVEKNDMMFYNWNSSFRMQVTEVTNRSLSQAKERARHNIICSVHHCRGFHQHCGSLQISSKMKFLQLLN